MNNVRQAAATFCHPSRRWCRRCSELASGEARSGPDYHLNRFYLRDGMAGPRGRSRPASPDLNAARRDPGEEVSDVCIPGQSSRKRRAARSSLATRRFLFQFDRSAAAVTAASAAPRSAGQGGAPMNLIGRWPSSRRSAISADLGLVGAMYSDWMDRCVQRQEQRQASSA